MGIFGPTISVGSASHSAGGRRLARTLSWPHLIALGVGAIVGTGIYTLTGVGADRAGPAVILAFGIAGVVCACAALCYAELSTAIPASGSAYTYSYAAIGRTVAWVVGWSLVLEYSLACSTVAVGWSAHLVGALHAGGVRLPEPLLVGPHAGGIVNLPAVLVALAVGGLLLVGTRVSATLNIGLVLLKLAALVAFVLFAAPAVEAGNYSPFMPYGFFSDETGGQVRGVMAAAAIVLFAFFGFDAVSTSAEEAKRPGRDLLIGIMGSMALCTTIYMAVAATAVGALPFIEFSKSGEPLAHILRELGHGPVAGVIAAAALIGLPSVIVVMMYGQSRIFFAMSRDGLLPRRLSVVSSRGVPTVVTVVTSVFVAIIAGLFRLDEIAELSNAGTLTAFVAVGISLMVMRARAPDLERPFRCPAPYLVGTLAIAGCLFLFFSLPSVTTSRFLWWNGIGLLIHFALLRWGAGRIHTSEEAASAP